MKNYQANLELLQGGKLLPLVEDFYTIQGEGYHTGKPAYFVRLGGCDVGCSWCDAKFTWNPKVFPPVTVEEIVERASNHPAQAVVVTGGEPLRYPLDLLCAEFKARGMKTFLETSGTQEMSGLWDWVCLSPKPRQAPLQVFYNYADELKVIIQTEQDFEWAEQQAQRVSSSCLLYLQPEWSVIKHILPAIIEYVKEHPQWNVSLQSHKYMNIP